MRKGGKKMCLQGGCAYDLRQIRAPGVTACQPNHGWEVTIVSADKICGAGQLGFRASLHPWHSFLNRFVKIASCPEGCLSQPRVESRSRLVSESPPMIPAP
jgi:hypothetical protein